MHRRMLVSALIDVAASVLAIASVLGFCFASERISMDLRAIFALTCVAFFLAGFARGTSGVKSIAWRAFRLSLGGLLGIAALIVNNGFHRLSMSASLMVGAVLAATAGILVRRARRANRMKAFQIAGGWLIACAVATLVLLPRLSTYAAFDSRQGAVKPFALSVDGRPVSSNALRGHVVVLAFWASWCTACYEELPHVQRVHAKFKDDPRVILYAVDTGWLNETAEKGKSALLRHRLDLPMAFDSGQAAQALNVDSLPAVVVMDANGNLRSSHFGFDNSENMTRGLEHQIRTALESMGNELSARPSG